MGVSRREFMGTLVGAATLAAWPGLAYEPRDTTVVLPPLPEEAAIETEEYWAMVRAHFMLHPDVAYLNTGTHGVLPRSVYETVNRYLAADYTIYRDLTGLPPLDPVWANAAEFVGAAPEEIALTRNTTEGMCFIANGLPLEAGDEVLTSNHEHAGGLTCWQVKAKRYGINIRYLQLPSPPRDPDELLNLINDNLTPRTKVISLSHIMCTTGLLIPAKEISTLARAKGIWSVFDGAHCPGMIDLSLGDMDCDFYAASPHKWLCAPKGSGLLYVKPDWWDLLWPTVMGDWDWEEKGRTARKFEHFGSRELATLAGLNQAILFQNRIGKQRIENRVRALATYLKEQLQTIPGVTLWTSMQPELSAALASFQIEGIPHHQIATKLWEKDRMRVRQVGEWEHNLVRISTHIYNTYEEVDRLLELLREIAAGKL